MVTFKTSRTELRAPDMCPNCLKNLTHEDSTFISMASRHTETKTARHRNPKEKEESTIETTEAAEVVLNVQFCNPCYDDYHYSEAIEYLPVVVILITVVVYIAVAWLSSASDANAIARISDFGRGLWTSIPILIVGAFAALVAWYYANSRMDPERKAAREKARSALHLSKISMTLARIDIREPLYAEKFREINGL